MCRVSASFWECLLFSFILFVAFKIENNILCLLPMYLHINRLSQMLLDTPFIFSETLFVTWKLIYLKDRLTNNKSARPHYLFCKLK